MLTRRPRTYLRHCPPPPAPGGSLPRRPLLLSPLIRSPSAPNPPPRSWRQRTRTPSLPARTPLLPARTDSAPVRSRCWARLLRARWPTGTASSAAVSPLSAGRQARRCTTAWSCRPVHPSRRRAGCRSSSRWNLTGSGGDGMLSPGRDKRRRRPPGPRLPMMAGARLRSPAHRPRAGITSAGLPKRVPKANLVPGTAGSEPAAAAAAPAPARSAAATRSASRTSSEVSRKAAPPGAATTRLRIETMTVAREARTRSIGAVVLTPPPRLSRKTGAQAPAAKRAGAPEAGHERKEHA